MMKHHHSFLRTTLICFLLPAVASVSAQPIAAGPMVTNNVALRTLVAGNPAKFKKESYKFQFIEQMIPLKLLHVVLIYLAVIRSSFARLLPAGRKNVDTFFMYGIDQWKAVSQREQSRTRLDSAERKQLRPKAKAKKSKWRIRETASLSLAVFGGSTGAWLGLKFWHLKPSIREGTAMLIIS